MSKLNDTEVLTEALIAFIAAIGEQLDLDRLLRALHKHCEFLEESDLESAQEIREIIIRVGQHLTTLSSIRDANSSKNNE